MPYRKPDPKKLSAEKLEELKRRGVNLGPDEDITEDTLAEITDNWGDDDV